MGYTPLFDTLTSGTLCGRWPDIGLWPIVLSLSDRHGIVDKTPTYIASITGLAVDDVVACLARFCEPDPHSRSRECGGARLRLIDPDRAWGWLIVNHAKYREKARKASYDSARTESGEDADRKRASRAVPRSPARSRSPNTNTNKEEEKREDVNAAAPLPLSDGLNLTAWNEWMAYRSERRLPAYKASSTKKNAGFLAKHTPEVQQQIVDYSVRNSYSGLFEPKDTHGTGKSRNAPRPTAWERSEAAMEQWARERGIDPSTI
jgi:hypothetical protein